MIYAMILVCLILVFLFGFLAGKLSLSQSPRHVDGPTAYAAGPAEQMEAPAEVELIKRAGDQWVRIGSRHPDHPDVHNVRAGLEPGVFIRGEHPDA